MRCVSFLSTESVLGWADSIWSSKNCVPLQNAGAWQ